MKTFYTDGAKQAFQILREESKGNNRQCGDCQLCCKLLPMVDNEPWRKGKPLDKPAGVRCIHQRHHKGCAIYADRPWCCKMWTCRWLVNDDVVDLSRPDRSHYVIDVIPDYVTVAETGDKIPVIQIWCDPDYPDAHRDPALRRYLERRAAEGVAAQVRYNHSDSLMIFAPAFFGKWREIGGKAEQQHTMADIAQAIGLDTVVVAEDSK